MSRVITTIKRKRGFNYSVDKYGNVREEKYRWIKDKSTIVMIIILLLGGLYYLQMSSSVTNADNFDEYCMIYYEIRADYILNNPGGDINVKDVLEYYYELKSQEVILDINPNNE